jgi:hypothetical protein
MFIVIIQIVKFGNNKLMLILKKITTKKLIISILIIVFMISGTAFALYENKNLTSRKSGAVNTPMVFGNSIPGVETTVNGGNTSQTDKTNNQAVDTNKINQNGAINLNIFSSEKFKILEESVPVISEQPETGKRNPFKPN